MTFDFFDSGLTYMLRLGLTPSSIKFSFIDSHLMFFARQCLHNNLPDCSCIYSNAYFFRGSCNKPGILKTEELLEEITATVLSSSLNAIKATRYEAHPFQPAEEVHGKVNFQSAKVSLSVA